MRVARGSRRNGERDERGFTLVEFVVALSLIAIVAVGFVTSISLGFRTVAVARQRQTASELASARLEHLRNVPFTEIAMSTAPSHNADVTHPDHWVNGSKYDVNGAGNLEDLIIDTQPASVDGDPIGDVLHMEDPVPVGSTVMEVYQYATWAEVDKVARVTVVVRFKAPAANSVNQMVRASTLFTVGTVTFTPGATSTTTPGPTTTTTAPPSTTTTTSGACVGDATPPTGTFSIGSSGAADAGYTASKNVTLHLSFTDACLPIVANFSNDGTDWGTDVTYDAASPQVSWPLTSGSGVKTVHGRVRDGAGNMVTLASGTIELDETAPTTPPNVAYTVSCQGSNRTINITWGASTDVEGNLRGYRVSRSTDGTSWNEIGLVSAAPYSEVHAKGLTSVRFRVAAYDRAGNLSTTAPTPPISLTKNQCN
jgi:prepilin-type N-terminal cleavage/methylation domain-containing protein